MRRYRVECNFGSRYFSDIEKAYRYYNKCKAKRLDVELWLINYHICHGGTEVLALQHLIEYSGTNIPKF